jgi:serine/threonine protein kinase
MVEKSGRVRLIDFGVARLFKPGKSKDTASFGTKGFAPPEQYGKGQTDARSDVYALGATLHYLLTMHDPSDDPFHFPPITALNPGVSRGTSSAIAKAVNFERADRWPSMAAFAAALKTPPASSASNQAIVTPVIPLAAAAASTAVPAVHPPVKPARPAASAPSSTTCTQCGTYLTNLDVHCPNCGTPRSANGSSVGTVLTAINLCQQCGTRLSNIDKKCPNCGTARQSKVSSAQGKRAASSPTADTPHGMIWFGWGIGLLALILSLSGSQALLFGFVAEALLMIIAIVLLVHENQTAKANGRLMLIVDFILVIISTGISASL